MNETRRGQRGRGLFGHSRPHAGESIEWYTPPDVFEALGLSFDLDPCAPEGGLPWIPAKRFYSQVDDGLASEWSGLIWLNPPYGPHVHHWLRKLASHGDGVALVPARTETRWFQEVVPSASAVCFVAGRLTFVDQDCTPAKFNAGAPTVLLGYGAVSATAIEQCGLGMIFRPAASDLSGQTTIWEAL